MHPGGAMITHRESLDRLRERSDLEVLADFSRDVLARHVPGEPSFVAGSDAA